MRYQHEKVFLLGMLMFLVLTGCQEKKIVRIGPPPHFIRGDSNGNMHVDIGDAIAIVQYLNTPEAGLHCIDAADADDNGRVEEADAIYILYFVNAQGPPPPHPYPECGIDSTSDRLRCEEHPCMEGVAAGTKRMRSAR